MKTSEVLYRAAEVQRERGRCSYDFSNPRGGVCMWGAINVVVNGDPFDWTGVDPLAEGGAPILAHVERVTGIGVPEFSNDHCRNVNDMCAALEIAADIAAAEGN